MLKDANITYSSTRHAKYAIHYHFIWCPKYRSAILDRPEVVRTIRDSIEKTVKSLGCSIVALEVMPDHVHLSLSALPRFSPAYLIGRIKGKSGRAVAARFPEIKRRGKVWSRSYFCATTGIVSTDTIKRYIENQWSRIE